MDETARDPCLQLQAALERVFGAGAEDPALRAAIIAKNLYYHTANNGNNNSNAQPNYSWNTWVICQQFILYALIRFQFRLKVNAKLRTNINWSLMRSRLRLRLIHKPLEIPPREISCYNFQLEMRPRLPWSVEWRWQVRTAPGKLLKSLMAMGKVSSPGSMSPGAPPKIVPETSAMCDLLIPYIYDFN